MVATPGALNDIDVSKLTLTGQGDVSYTLTSPNVEITSDTKFAVVLNEIDQIHVEGLLNKNGAVAADTTPLSIAAATGCWHVEPDNADLTGNAVTVSNVQEPTITSATYDVNTGVLVVTGENFVKASGALNDIIANTFTFTGEGGAEYTLTNTPNIEIISATKFTLTLGTKDRIAVEPLLNKTGTASNDATNYNLAAADDWMTGTNAAMDIADLTGKWYYCHTFKRQQRW